MSDCFDHFDEGVDEEVEIYLSEIERERKQKDQRFEHAVSKEVERQLKKHLATAEIKTSFEANKANLAGKPQRGVKKQVNCRCCGTEFLARVADINRGWGMFCSKSCKIKKQKNKNWSLL